MLFHPCFCRVPTASRLARQFGLLLALSLGALASLQAQTIYRHVGADGGVSFSDRPGLAPGQTTLLEGNTSNASAPSSVLALPFELRQVVSKYPVTLYSANACAPCDSGRQLLLEHGIVFSERTISSNADIQALQDLSASTSLPVLRVASQTIKGFLASEWLQYLQAAGYPEKSVLPPNYRHAPARALVPPAVAPSVAASASSGVAALPPALPVAPPVAPVKINAANPAGIEFQ